ncbi:thioredoxin domain-containing protein [bacterium]|nr:thioredoxin domain-containing protein [bacterium]
MKNYTYALIFLVVGGCVPESAPQREPGLGAAQPSQVVVAMPDVTEHPFVLFATNTDNGRGRKMYREIIKPLIEGGTPVDLQIIPLLDKGIQAEAIARCLGSKGDAFRVAILDAKSFPEDFADLGATPECVDADVAKVQAETDLFLQGVEETGGLTFETAGGSVSTRSLPFLQVGPYRLDESATPALVKTLWDELASGIRSTQPRVVVVVGDCPECPIESSAMQIAGALGVSIVEWRAPSDPVGDWYLDTAGPSAHPALFVENITIPRNLEGAFVTAGELTLIHHSNLGPIIKVVGLDSIPGGHREGSPTAPILHTFEDFECPACGAFNRGALPTLKREFIDTGLMGHAFHQFPLSGHQYAKEAAIASECAGQQSDSAFWAYKDMLFNNQEDLEGAALVRYAGLVGLDLDAFQVCRSNDSVLESIDADLALGEKVGVSGTPSLFLPPYRVDASRDGLSQLAHLLAILGPEE